MNAPSSLFPAQLALPGNLKAWVGQKDLFELSSSIQLFCPVLHADSKLPNQERTIQKQLDSDILSSLIAA